MSKPYGRIYFATEYAIAKEDRTTRMVGTVEQTIPKPDADYSKGYRAVIWGADGRRLYSNEVPKLDLDTTPGDAFVRLKAEAKKLVAKHGPIDLYAHGAGDKIATTVKA